MNIKHEGLNAIVKSQVKKELQKIKDVAMTAEEAAAVKAKKAAEAKAKKANRKKRNTNWNKDVEGAEKKKSKGREEYFEGPGKKKMKTAITQAIAGRNPKLRVYKYKDLASRIEGFDENSPEVKKIIREAEAKSKKKKKKKPATEA
jgi:hypothetical protein